MKFIINILIVYLCISPQLFAQDFVDKAGSGCTYAVRWHDGIEKPEMQDPIWFIEGLDVNNETTSKKLNNKFSGLIKDLIALGHDIAFINYNQGGISLNSNKIHVANTMKILANRVAPNSEISVLGYSMGGVVARMALNYIEETNYPIDVKTFISIDAPQRGANAPYSMQLFALDFATLGLSEDFNDLKRMLNSAAAKEMLIYTKDYNNEGITHDSKFQSLYSGIHNSSCNGYPVKTRNIAVSFGSSAGVRQSHLASGEKAATYDSWFLKGYLSTVPSNDDPESNSSGKATLLQSSGYLNHNTKAQYSGHIPVDLAPGSREDFFGQLCDGLNIIGVSCDAKTEYACFIPTISALDMQTDDLFFEFKHDVNRMNSTPFDAIYASDLYGNTSWPNSEHLSPSMAIGAYEFIVDHITNTIGRDVLPLIIRDGIIYDPTFEGLEGRLRLESGSMARVKDFDGMTFLPGSHFMPGTDAHFSITKRNKPCDFQNVSPSLRSLVSDNYSESQLENVSKGIISPNPNNGNFKLEIPIDLIGSTINIYNSTGELIQTETINDLVKTFDFCQLTKGIYMMKVSGVEQTETHKIIIQ